MHGGIKRNECDMELLMTPAEVVEAAFGGGDVIDAAIVTESAVLAAQRRYLRPVFGVSFYGALEQGRYGAFLAEYVRPALALFVKYLVLPDAAVRLGRLGIVRFGGEYFEPTDGAALKLLRERIRAEAETSLTAAVERLEADPAEFPEYDPRENIKRRLSVAGGVVL